MKKGGKGGSHTAKAGSSFEIQTDEKLMRDLNNLGYDETALHRLSGPNGPIHGRRLSLQTGEDIDVFYKSGIYKLFFEPKGIDYKTHFSARLEPDTAIYSDHTKVLTIIEKKQMTSAGSVAEKLQTCDYKRKYYEKLASGLNIEVEIKWILGQYFKNQQKQLKSVYEYMLENNSQFYFDFLPVEELNITSKKD